MDTEKKLRIYFDTSIPSHLFVEDRLDWMAYTWELWERCVAGEYEIFVSDVFFDELDRCPQPKLDQMYEQLDLIEFERLKQSDEVEELANKYVKMGVLTERKLNDCLHIAYAVTNDCDVVLSWNFSDIVNDSTRDGVKVVNAIGRYREIRILSPEDFLKGRYK